MSEVPSQKTQAKAAEYLLAGRVKVQRVTFDVEEAPDGSLLPHFLAHVSSAASKGDPYFVKFTHGEWRCDCPAQTTCSHIIACQAIAPPFQNPESEKINPAIEALDIDAFLGDL